MTDLKYLFVLALGVSIISISALQSTAQVSGNIEVVTQGYQFTEGPFLHPDGYLLFSDIPANTIYKWKEGSSTDSLYLKPSGHSNGITWDTVENRVIVAQHDGRISAIEGDSLHPLVTQYEGKRLNSPNDVAVKSDGVIYFTDPPFGVSDSLKELEINGVYRLNRGGNLELLYDKLQLPNGIVFSPNESTLYVNDSSDGRILSFEVSNNDKISDPREFANVGVSDSTGAADGMVVDNSGRLYSTGPGGIYVFSDSGEQIAKVDMPAQSTNLEWTGEKQEALYVTTPTAIYRVKIREVLNEE